jgi:hypothetical protein
MRIILDTKSLVICCFLIVSTACIKNTLDPATTDDPKRLVRQYGSDETFDIATWNIEHFPLQDRITVSYLAQLIRDLNIDMIGFQEINDQAYFRSLIDSLPDYAGFLSKYPSDYLKLAVIYKRDMISISTPYQIFIDDRYTFPRPPLVTYVEVRENDRVAFDFTLIINHLKAFGDDESRNRRNHACGKLKNFIDSQILTSHDKDFISIGDYNDKLDIPISQNVFKVFLEDSVNYRFLTSPLINEVSYIGNFNSLIDHLLITRDCEDEYGDGSTEILYLDKEFDKYSSHISDHRPVLSRFRVF